jgi:hypothetical protein
MIEGAVGLAKAKTGDVVNHVFYGRKAKQLAAIMRRSRLQQERLSLTVPVVRTKWDGQPAAALILSSDLRSRRLGRLIPGNEVSLVSGFAAVGGPLHSLLLPISLVMKLYCPTFCQIV